MRTLRCGRGQGPGAAASDVPPGSRRLRELRGAWGPVPEVRGGGAGHAVTPSEPPTRRLEADRGGGSTECLLRARATRYDARDADADRHQRDVDVRCGLITRAVDSGAARRPATTCISQRHAVLRNSNNFRAFARAPTDVLRRRPARLSGSRRALQTRTDPPDACPRILHAPPRRSSRAKEARWSGS